MSQDDAPDDSIANDEEALTDIHFVGPATASVLAEASFDATGISDKTVSYEMLRDAGVNPGVATRLRKEHSLHWSFGGSDENGNSLNERSEKMGGLQEDEREWVAASSGDWESKEHETTTTTGNTGSAGGAGNAENTGNAESAGNTELTGGDWSPTGKATTDGSGAAEEAEAAWRERSKPDPVTDVPGVDDRIAKILANGGITSVRSLATADPQHVADSLGLQTERVEQWRNSARDLA